MLRSIFKPAKSFSCILSMCLFSMVACAAGHMHQEQPRYTPGVVSIITDHHYIQTHDAPVYWTISPYYMPQLTNASCSLASSLMILNALRSKEVQYRHQKLVTTGSLLKTINPHWAHSVKQGGEGVTLDQLGSYLKGALKSYRLFPVTLKVYHVTNDNNSAIKFHNALLKSEKTGQTFIIVNYDHKFTSGTKSVGHFAPVGAYDSTTNRVLIMDPDRESFEPYWVPEHVLFNAMATKDATSQKSRGFIVLKMRRFPRIQFNEHKRFG